MCGDVFTGPAHGYYGIEDLEHNETIMSGRLGICPVCMRKLDLMHRACARSGVHSQHEVERSALAASSCEQSEFIQKIC